ncbi:MAG: tail fiber domain-containing protein [Patescibacteria group bacterium]|jgi:hypothetical protein
MPWLDRKRLLKSRLENLREAGKFLGLSILSIILVLFILGWVAYAFQASAATGINSQLNYQGKLNDSSGVAVSDGTYNIKLAIYAASSGGTCLWTAVGSCADGNVATTTVTTVNGVFSVTLGGSGQNSLATSTIATVYKWNTDSLYLGVTIRGTTASPVYDEEMTPRKRITSSAYAFNADLVDGISATSTAAVANELLALDAFGNLNLFNQGVSSTYATTSWLLVRESSTMKELNATSTNVDNLTVFNTGTFNWLSATTSLDYWFNASSTLGSWDYLKMKPATSTVLSLLDSDYRISTLNATSTLTDHSTTTGNLYTGRLCFANGNCYDDITTILSGVEFFLHEDDSDVVGYEKLLRDPASGAQTTDFCNAEDSLYCAIDEYVTETDDLNTTVIPSGTWSFHTFINIDSNTGVSNMVIRVYARTAGGAETQLFSATSTELTTGLKEYQISTVQSEFNINTTDRLVVKYLGWSTSAAARTITLYYEGTANYSHLVTPFTVVDLGSYVQRNINETITANWIYNSLTTFSDLRATTLNATTTNVDNLKVLNTGTFNWLSATSSLDYWFNASSTLASGLSQWYYPWTGAITPTSSVGIFVNASSTIAANFRVDGNATTTGHFEADSNFYVKDGMVSIGIEPGIFAGASTFINYETWTGNTGTLISNNFISTFSPTTNSNSLNVGINNDATGNGTEHQTYIAGYLGTTNYEGTASLENLIGLQSTAELANAGSVTSTVAIGGLINNGIADTDGGGDMTNAYVFNSAFTIGTQAGTIANAYMYNSNGFVLNGGTITNAYGLNLETPAYNGGTITNLYGIYIDNQTGATNNYAIYTNTGNVRFGDDLLVVGNATTSGYLVVGTTNPTTNLGAGDLLVGRNATTTNHFEADSTFYVKEGQVGIATSTPWATYELAVNGEAIITGDTLINNDLYVAESYAADGANGNLFLGRNVGNWESLIWNVSNNQFELSDELAVTGNLYVSGYASTTNLVLGNDGSNLGTYADLYVNSGNLFFNGTQLTGSSGLSFWQYNPGLSNSTYKAISPTSTDIGIFVTASSTIAANFRVDGNATTTGNTSLQGTLYVKDGNVGIGTSTPQQELFVNNSTGEADIVMSSALNNDVNLRWTIEGKNKFNIFYDASDGDLAFYDNVGVAQRMTIDTTGNVGIGTTAPGDLLSVNGKTFLGGNASTTGTLVVNAQSGYTGWAAPTNTFTVVGSGLFTGNATTSGNFTAQNTLYVKDDNVGIGTASPRAKLEVKSAGTIVTFPAGTQDLIIDNYSAAAASEAAILLGGSGTGGYGIYSKILQTNNGNFGSLQFQSRADAAGTGWTTRMTIDATAGNVGIGLTAPGYKLDVLGTASTTDLYVGGNLARTSTSTNIYGGMIVDTDTLVVNANENRVGIGTASPAYPLDIYTASGDANLRVKSNTDDANISLTSNGDGVGTEKSQITFIDNVTSKWTIGKSDDNNFLLYDYTRGSTIFRAYANGNLALMENGGNVGIGTTAPGDLLSVNGKTFLGGNASTTGTLVVNAQSGYSGWAAPTNTLTVVGSGYFTTNLRVSGNATTSGNLNVSGYASTTNLVLADGASNLGTYSDLYVNSGNLFFNGTQLTGSNGLAFWQYNPGLSNSTYKAISPTSTDIGFFVNASSTVAANFRVDGNATTTGNTTLQNTLYVKDSSVGIGTTDLTDYKSSGNNYSSELVVDLASTVTTWNTAQSQLTLRNSNTTANNWSGLAFASNDGTNTAYGAAIAAQFTDRTAGGWTSAELAFFTGTKGAAPLERMRIDKSGNVGIGLTPVAGRKLQVTSGASEHPLWLQTADRWGGLTLSDTADNIMMYVYPDDADLGGTILNLRDAGTTKVMIDTDGDTYFNGGNVGIGTTIPLTKLQVGVDNAGEALSMGSLVPQVAIMGAQNNTSEDSILRLIRPTYSGNLYPASVDFKMSTWNSLGCVNGCASRTKLTIGLKDGTLYDTSNVADIMTLLSSGNVGIGTTAPYYKLEVSAPTATTTLYVVGNTRLEGNATTTGNVYLGTNQNNFVRLEDGQVDSLSLAPATSTVLIFDSQAYWSDDSTYLDGQTLLSNKGTNHPYFSIDMTYSEMVAGPVVTSKDVFSVMHTSSGDSVGIGLENGANSDLIWFDTWGTYQQGRQGTQYFGWLDTLNEFYLTNNFAISGNATTTGWLTVGIVSPARTWATGDASIGNRLLVDEDIYVGESASNDDDSIFFDAGNESIVWDDSPGEFDFSDDVNITGSATTSNTLQVTSGLATGGAQPNSTTTANFGGNVMIQGNATTTGKLIVGAWNATKAMGIDVYSLVLPNVANNTGYGYAYGWFSASDGRFKVNQRPLNYGLDDLMKLNPKRYTQYGGYIEDGQAVFSDEGNETIGLIAQEVYGIMPEVTNSAGNGLWAINYDKLTPVIIKSIQELATKVDQLLARLDKLDNGGTETESDQPASDTPAPTSGQVKIFDVEVLGNIIGRQQTDFFGLMTVWAEADFRQNVFFKGLAYFNQDTAGTAIIKAGATSTEVVFTKEYEVVPKVTVSLQQAKPVFYGINNKRVSGFRIVLIEPFTEDLTFDWIALAVKSDLATSLPPMIEEFNLPLTEISLDQGMELKAKVFDPDTKTENLSYTWSVSPKVGEFNGDSNTALVWWQITTPLPQDTEVTITLEVSDGQNSTSQSKVVKVLGEVFGCINPEASNFNPLARFDDGSCKTSGQEEPSVVLGCTDQTALNYNSTATQDDGTCTYNQEPVAVLGCTDQLANNYNSEATEDDGTCTYPEPVVQEPEPEPTEPIAQDDTDGVGGPE